MKAFSHPDYEKNAKRCKGEDMPCAYCGKPISPARQKSAVWVEICCHIINPDDSHDPHGAKGLKGHEQHGGYPIGSECARKLAAAKTGSVLAVAAKALSR